MLAATLATQVYRHEHLLLLYSGIPVVNAFLGRPFKNGSEGLHLALV